MKTIEYLKPLKINADKITEETLKQIEEQIEEQKQMIKNLDENEFLKYIVEEIDTILKDGSNIEPYIIESKVLFAKTDNNHVILTYPAIAISNALKGRGEKYQKAFIEKLRKNGVLKRVRQRDGRNMYDERGNLCEIEINGNKIVGSRFIVINRNTEGVYARHSRDANSRNIEKVMSIAEIIGNDGERRPKIKIENILEKSEGNNMNDMVEKINKILDKKGQIILYGVPGTGKTWLANNYVREKTNDDKNKSEFTTFHQSYSYEDFIEGFRPKNENGNIIYEVEDGIFKRMCILAIWDSLNEKYIFKNTNFYDVSLGKKDKEEDKPIFDYCIKNNVICVGFNDDTDYTKYTQNIDKIGKKEMEKRREEIYKLMDEKGVELYPQHKSSIKYIVLEMKKGDIVLVSDGTTKIKAIGVIAGDYEYKKDSPLKDFNMYQFRKVKWLWVGSNENEYINVENIKSEKLGMGTIHCLDREKLNLKFIKKYITPHIPYNKIKKIVIKKLTEQKSKNIFKEEDFKNAPKYYLIIDEINRGNISNILGELITLLEKDKRLGEDNEIITTLPYSKEPFAVPPNLYIIGTINTADRSIALLDIALRRRFGFMEVEPNYEAIKDKNIEGIDSSKLLEALNKKIVESIDKDHRIGHSYFLKVENIEDLKFVWYYEIIPLLEEYFYGNTNELKKIIGDFIGDYGLIKELDGNKFITALNNIISNNQGEGNE